MENSFLELFQSPIFLFQINLLVIILSRVIFVFIDGIWTLEF